MLPVPSYLNPTEFFSCIKIAGTCILPPLVTEERRKQLNEDKAKAVEIEKKLKQKRSSIDSGVMIGSYIINNFKNNEMQQTENVPLHQISLSDLACNGNIENINTSSNETDNIVCDSFLKSALEDTEFREFFYSTAEKIFKDNKILNFNKETTQCKTNIRHAMLKESEKAKATELLTHCQSGWRTNALLDINVCNDLTLVPTHIENNPSFECLENVHKGNLHDLQIEKEISSQYQIVRRNSYTLENPSPVLLEHMAKENANNKVEKKEWQSLSERKDKDRGLEFKTFFSPRKTRKPWNKKIANHSSIAKMDHSFPLKTVPKKHPLKRSNTFVKSNKKGEDNCSLPCSSHTSPIQFSLFTQSVDCIKSMMEKTLTNESSDAEPVKEIKGVSERILCDNKNIVIIHKGVDLESAIPNISTSSLLNNTSDSVHSNFATDISFLPHYEHSDSASQISGTTQSTLSQQNTECNRNLISNSKQSKRNHSGDVDDSVSLCSSLSLSKFMPLDNNVSRPSTAEDLSALFSELQLQHEREITELLEKQYREKVMLTKFHSNTESISSRNTTNLSTSELPYENRSSNILCSENKRTPCSRELFPIENYSTTGSPKNQDNYSEKEKKAALKLTACVRGYLTRRLLKTEKVQQLIYVIKESLNCAFSLQSEPQLKRNDLELHERLAHQLSAALYELQTVITAPACKRMAIIAADREKLRNPILRPSSAISSATRKSLLRKQQSMNGAEKKIQETRTRTKSLCLNESSGPIRSNSFAKSDSSSTTSTNSNRKPWR